MRETVAKGIKISFACAMSILTAMVLGLENAITAGIITILSIGDTKMATFRVAGKRSLGFLCSMALAAVCFYGIGFSTLGFVVYILCFILVCLLLNWQEAITINAVLVSHIWFTQCFSLELFLNELLLFIIGIGFGILINLLLRKNNREFEALAEEVDTAIKEILIQMSRQILIEEEQVFRAEAFLELKEKIAKAELCAMQNYDNTLLNKSIYELEYVEMRQKQGMVLEEIYKSICMIEMLPRQVHAVGEFLRQVAEEYHRDNDVENLLQKLNSVFESMKIQELPHSREEFEARAVLYYLLKQMEEFLRLKNEFVRRQRKHKK